MNQLTRFFGLSLLPPVPLPGRNTLPSFRCLHSSQQNHNLIAEKYAEKINQKLKEKGLRDLEELKKINQDRIEADRIQQRKLYDELVQKARQKLASLDQSSQPTKQGGLPSSQISKTRQYSSPIKVGVYIISPLDSIIDVDKVASQSANEITKLWVAYHLSTSNPPRLGAVIPTGTYEEMIESARKYPSFVIPLAKSSSTSSLSPDKSNPADLPFEMQYLQWDFVKQPPEPNLPDFLKAKTTCTIPATIVMYTPLGEYKLRQSFAQPTLILTHYTDLANSHGIVLMRGDITPASNGSPKITPTEAQLMILRFVDFFQFWIK
ncbi:hypothetical protein VP01_9g16 [Puccinia sorghi]|uniref:ATP synthase mitochondrial F1 complex assembly factor 1 n=1 Tax=Puccinia sorghi TaxID=27349 RepID=A0A0L6U561_9BASI|nr:hypothetical protein VP01_9g16 [Puccinia sorghi]